MYKKVFLLLFNMSFIILGNSQTTHYDNAACQEARQNKHIDSLMNSNLDFSKDTNAISRARIIQIKHPFIYDAPMNPHFKPNVDFK